MKIFGPSDPLKEFKTPIIEIDNFFANKFLFLGIFYGFSLLALAIYSPLLNKILKTTKEITNLQLILVLSIGIITTLILEIIKILANFFKKNGKVYNSLHNNKK